MATIILAVGLLALSACVSQIVGQALAAYLLSSKWFFRRTAKNSNIVSREFLGE